MWHLILFILWLPPPLSAPGPFVVTAPTDTASDDTHEQPNRHRPVEVEVWTAPQRNRSAGVCRPGFLYYTD